MVLRVLSNLPKSVIVPKDITPNS